jgi:glycosyltransferase involved in cell wall biosynthesis
MRDRPPAPRVGFVSGSLTAIGGGRGCVLPLAAALARRGCPVYGLQVARWRRGFVRLDGLPVWREPLWPQLLRAPAAIRSPGPAVPGERPLSAYESLAAAALDDAGRRLALDVVYALYNSTVALLLAGRRPPSRPLVINLAGYGIDPSRGGAADTFPYQGYIFRRPHWALHVVATRAEYEGYRGVYDRLGLDPARLIHLPHPFDQARFHPAALDRRRERDAGARLLLYPVNVYRRKNLELAIDLLRPLAERWPVRLVVTGRVWDRAYLGELRRRAARAGVGDWVRFLGGVPIAQLADLYRRADATIFTSHQETFGHGLVESLGSGAPVVGPGWIAPCREILSESYGGWCADKDVDSFAAVVAGVLADPPDAARVAAEARARYGNETIAARFLAAIERALAAGRQYEARLAAIDWKGLYGDAGELL